MSDACRRQMIPWRIILPLRSMFIHRTALFTWYLWLSISTSFRLLMRNKKTKKKLLACGTLFSLPFASFCRNIRARSARGNPNGKMLFRKCSKNHSKTSKKRCKMFTLPNIFSSHSWHIVRCVRVCSPHKINTFSPAKNVLRLHIFPVHVANGFFLLNQKRAKKTRIIYAKYCRLWRLMLLLLQIN